jgi:hypothetical protein
MGIELGVSRDGSNTIITRILENDKTLERIKAYINLGDILISINDRVVLDEPFSDVMGIVDLLTLGGFPRRYKFLNYRKCSLDAYLLKVEQSSRLKTDMLGFNSSVEEILSEQALRQQTRVTTMQRDLEWVDYLKSIGGPENLKPAGIYKASPDLKAMVRRGIPVAFRALIWPRISLSSIHRIKYPKDYYQQLLSRIEAGELCAKVKDDIEKDVDRTFPEHVYFGHSGRGEAVLRRVLQAFALHNPEIGYCQSLNFVAGMILILLEEEEAFWLLVTIVEKLLPPDYYTKSMVGTYVDQFVLAHIIKKYLPRIHSAMDRNQLQLPLITVQWFMCIFVNTLRPEVTLRVWDMFLNEGNKVLFRIAAALFKLHEKRLMTVKDAGDLFTVLRGMGKDIVDADVLIGTAYKDFFKMSNQRVVRSRLVSTEKSPNPHKKAAQNSVPTSPQTPRSAQRRRTIAAKIQTSFSTLISPRLTSKSFLGAVPKDLIGVGFAHTGPIDALEKYRAESSSSTSNEQQAVAETMIETRMVEFGGRIENELSAAEAEAEEETYEDSSATTPVPSTPEKATPSEKKYDDELMINPGVLLNRVSEINRPGSFSEFKKQFDAKKGHPKPKRSDQRDRKARNGEFSFYRADIALWRSSFRPGLEERHSMMEAARSKWRSENAVALAAAAASSGGVPNEMIGEELGNDFDSETSSIKNIRRGSGEEGHALVPLSLNAVSIDRLSTSRSKPIPLNCHSPSGAAVVTSASTATTALARRRSRSNSGIFMSSVSSDTAGGDEEEAIVLETTYSIDHTFDTDPIQPVSPPQIPGLRPRNSFTLQVSSDATIPSAVTTKPSNGSESSDEDEAGK